MNYNKNESELIALCACHIGIYGKRRVDTIKNFLEEAEVGKGVYLRLSLPGFNLNEINGWIQYIDGRLDFPTVYLNREPVNVTTKNPPNPLCKKLTKVPLSAIIEFNFY
ncbi:MAG: hypothetical protein AABX39_03515 [Nanoarchaeota archaeon]